MTNESKKDKFKINSIEIIKHSKSDFPIDSQRLSAEYLINLCLIEENSLEKENFIKIMAILSYLRYLASDLNFHMKITIDLERLFNSGIIFIDPLVIARAYYRMGELFFQKNNFIHSYHYLLLCQEHGEVYTLDNKSKKLLDISFVSTKSTLQSTLESIVLLYNDKPIETINDINEINTIIVRIKSKIPLDSKERKMYLISSKWFDSLMAFIQEYLKTSEDTCNDFIQKAFDKKQIHQNYFRDKGVNADSSYPFEIDNLILTHFEDQWIDPSQEHSFENVFLKPDINEYQDYHCLNEIEWTILTKLFSSTNEITRYKSLNDKLELYLEEIEVLIIDQNIKINQPNLLKIKKIQYSSQTIISQLIEKIKRCVGINNDKSKFNFYSVSNDNKGMIINLLIPYMLNCPKYQIPLNLLQIKMNDTVLTTITKNKLTSFFFIIEVVHENLTPFISTTINSCSNCSKIIKPSSSYQCKNCSYNYFCSESCLESDDYHKSVHNYTYWIPQFSTIQSISWNSFIRKDNNNGRTGLLNIGNSCYMNSALQCLSNTEDLTKYFLSGLFRKEINQYNNYGSKGALASTYEDLIDNLWNTRFLYANPSRFKQVLYQRTHRFGDYSMQDSQEMLNIFLDHLHEDINRINTKPYFEMTSQKSNEKDEEASSRWWECHKKREDSIIVDIFHGQFKSLITCPKCHLKNITYDPFMFLSLPIPIAMNKYKYIFIRLNQECLAKEIQYSSNCSISHIKLNISIAHKIKTENVEAIIFDKDKSPIEIGRDNLMIKVLLNEEKDVVFYEKDTNKNQYMLYVYPIVFITSFFSFLSPIPVVDYLAFPFAYSINSQSTLADLCFIVFQFIRHVLNANELVDIQAILTSKARNPKTKNALPFSLHILHRSSNNFLGKSYKCNHCENKYVPFCNIFNRFDLSTPITKIIQFSWNSPSFILAEIPYYDKNKRIYSDYNMPLRDSFSSLVISKKGDFTIMDCIDLFTSEEKLSKDNLWYCNECKQHEEATKKCNIYKAPYYLIIHLKRFKTCQEATDKNSLNQKNSIFISYPIEGLNIQDYIIGPESKNAIYDLYGVVKHMGSLNDGHYTAICKNNDQWIDYNDDKVTKTTVKSVINENAYLLFYKKKQ